MLLPGMDDFDLGTRMEPGGRGDASPGNRGAAAAKRIEDVTLAVCGLVLLAPVLAAAAAAVKLTSSGPVLFVQARTGLGGKPMRVFKFRTMYHHLRDEHCRRQTVRDDPRVTPVGRFLRRYSLDELPQLLNVLGGSMSVVGPRPHAMATSVGGRRFDEVVECYAARHRVKPGITGWAQVHGWRGETDTVEKIRRRVEHDLFYIDNWSVALDLRIVVLTVRRLWRDAAAY